MAVDVTAAFVAAQAKRSREGKQKVLLRLRNVAHENEGASATGGDLSTDYPAQGAIRGKASHLNMGGSAVADDGYGRDGWKSILASESEETTAADWVAGTQTGVVTVGDAIEVAGTASQFEDDFDDAVEGADLEDRGTWANTEAGGGAMTTDAAADYQGAGLGVTIQGGGSLEVYEDAHAFTPGTVTLFSFRIQQVESGNGDSCIEYRLVDSGGALLWRLNIGADCEIQTASGSSDLTRPAIRGKLTTATWHRIVGRLDRTTPASTTLKLYLEESGAMRQIDDDLFSTADLSAMRVRVETGDGDDAGKWYLDEVRITDELETSGTQENVVAWSAIPVSASGEIEWNGEALTVERLLDGTVASFALNNDEMFLRDTAAHEQVAFLLTPTETAPLDSLSLELFRVNDPGGNVWLELYSWSGTAPVTKLATSTGIATDDLEDDLAETGARERFAFAAPFAVQTGTTYAVILKGDFEIGVTGHVGVAVRTAVPEPTFSDSMSVPAGSAGSQAVTIPSGTKLLIGFTNSDNFTATMTIAGLTMTKAYSGEVGTACHGQMFAYENPPPGLQTWEVDGCPAPHGGSAVLVGISNATDDDFSFATQILDGEDATLDVPSTGSVRVLNYLGQTNEAKTPNGTLVIANQVSPINSRCSSLAYNDPTASPTTVSWDGSVVTANCQIGVAIMGVSVGRSYYYSGAAWAEAGYVAGMAGGCFHQTEVSYPIANVGAYLSVRNNADTTAVGQGFKVTYAKPIRHIQLALRQRSGAVFAAGSRIWLEIRSNSAGKPSATILATSGRYDPDTMEEATGTNGQLFTFSLTSDWTPVAATQYHWVLCGNYALNVTNCIEAGFDQTATSYPDGCMSWWNGSAWTLLPTCDFIFYILSEHRPHVEFSVAFSDNGASYGSYAQITYNPTQAGDGSAVIAGGLHKWWKIKATLVRVQSGGANASITPQLADYTVAANWVTAGTLTVDFNAARAIDRIELFGYEVTAGVGYSGFSEFKLYRSNNGSAWTLITEYDDDLSEASARNASATVSFATGVVTTTGQYVGLQLSETLTMTYLKIVVTDNSSDSYARINAIRAYQCADVTRRVISMSDSQDGESLLRRTKARSLSLTLNNGKMPADESATGAEGVLSSENTAGPWPGVLGDGVRILAWVGLEGAADWVKLGEFNVDDWDEDAASLSVRVSGRDDVAALAQTVQAQYKTGQRHHEIIEYLANLAGFPSARMDLDASGGVVEFFATQETEAWSQIQLLAEAIAFSRVWVDQNGKLRLAVRGHTAGPAGVDTSGVVGLHRVFGPPVTRSGKVYWLGMRGPAGGYPACTVVLEYDQAARTWAKYDAGYHSQALSACSAALLGTHGDNVYFMDWSIDPGGVLGRTRIVGWNAVSHSVAFWQSLDGILPTSPWTWYTRVAGLDDGRTAIVQGSPGTVTPNFVVTFQGDAAHPQTVYIASNGTSLMRFNLVTATFTGETLAFSGDDGGDTVGPFRGFCYENSTLFGIAQVTKGTGVMEHALYSLNMAGLTATRVATIANPNDDDARLMGFRGDGAGVVYFMLVPTIQTGVVAAPIYLQNIAIPGYTVTTHSLGSDQTPAVPLSAVGGGAHSRDTDAIVVTDDFVLAGFIANEDRRVAIFDRSEETLTDLGPLHMGGSRVATFASYEDDDLGTVLTGLMDEQRPFEFFPKAVDSPVALFTITSEDATDARGLAGATLSAGGDRGGNSRIVNAALVRSKPRSVVTDSAGAAITQTLWEADQTPWGLVAGRVLPADPRGLMVELREDAVPSSLAHVLTFASGTPATAAFAQRHARQPRVQLTCTTDGVLTAWRITGQAIGTQRTLIAVVADAQSIARYGLRVLALDNDYIYSTFSQNAVGGSIVARFKDKRANIRGIRCRLIAELEPWDTLHVHETVRLKVDADFVVAKFTRDHMALTMTLEVEGL